MRKRFQTGQLIDDGDRWTARWREDVLQPDGTVKRVRKWDVLAMKKDCKSKRDAQRFLDDRLRDVNRSDYKPTPAMTFSAFAAKWMETVMIHHSDSTQVEERRQIERDLKPVFGNRALKDITAEAVQAWVSGLKLAPKTVANRVGTLRTMWATAKAWGYVTHDPFAGLVMPTREAPEVYQFSAEEMMAIIAEAKGWYGLFFELLAKTGMRPGEAAALRPEDVEGRVVRVQQTVWKGKVRPRKTKTKGSKRSFVISDALAEKLRAHATPNDHGLIFTNQAGRPMNTNHFNDKVLKPILKRLGIWEKIPEGQRCGNYAFRHGNITEMDRAHVPLKTIQARVGHAIGSDVTRKHYSHAVSADDVAAADLMEELLSPRKDGEAVQ